MNRFSLSHRRFLLTIALVTVLTLIAPFAGRPSAAQETPAQNHAQVVAQGITGVPAQEIFWTISVFESGFVDATGQFVPGDQALTAPGFYLAGVDPILNVTSENVAAQLLAPGEAIFTSGQPSLFPLSLTGEPVPYFALSFSSVAGQPPEASTLLYSGEAFGVPPSLRDLDLVRDVLQPGEATTISGGEIPALFFVTGGDLLLTTPDGTSATLTAEQALTYVGDLQIENVGQAPAVFLSAIMTAEILPPAGASTGPLDLEHGTVTLRVYTCPPGMTSATLSPNACTAISRGFDAALSFPAFDGDLIPLAAAVAQDTAFRWEGLKVTPNNAQNSYTYSPLETTLPAGFASYVVTGDVTSANVIVLTEAKPDANVAFYNFQPAESIGTLTVDVAICPAPISPVQLSTDGCYPYATQSTYSLDQLNLSLNEPGGDLVDAVATQASSVRWALPRSGDYMLSDGSFGLGYQTAVVGDQVRSCCGQAGGFRVSIGPNPDDYRTTLYLYPPAASQGTGTDDDNDGLTLAEEQQLGTDPNLADTDGDTLFDGFEHREFSTNPLVADTDGDGYSDGEEYVLASDPLDRTSPGQNQSGQNADQDGDGLTDQEDQGLGTDHLNPDTDGDGRSDFDETRSLRPTNPFVTDSDGDGLSDGDEVNAYGTDPSYQDPDNDGYTDAEEVAAGTDPNDPLSNPSGSSGSAVDSDGDGISDDRELEIGTNPASGDSDGDGMSDGTEVHLGFDPTVPDQ